MVGFLYAIVLAYGMVTTPRTLPISGITLMLMEALTLAAAPFLVFLFSAILIHAARETKVLGAAALAFASLASGVTAAVHFVGLTALLQTHDQGLQWPSPLYAVELLAWDLFLGLALLAAAPTFGGTPRARALRGTLIATGTLCLLGVIGPLVGDMRFQLIGVVGYGLLLPFACLLLARYFYRLETVAHDPERPAA